MSEEVIPGKGVNKFSFVKGATRLLSNLALGSAAAVLLTFLARNFGTIAKLEGEFFRDLVGYSPSGGTPPIMAMHPVVVPIIIVIIIILCIISAVYIAQVYQKTITITNTFQVAVTTCTWTTSILGFLTCLVTTIYQLIIVLIHWVVVSVMYLLLLINVLGFLMMFASS